MEMLKTIHFWFGTVGIIIFLLTGQYMYHELSVLQGMEDGPRMLYRSAHIYFLLASILNLLVGAYLQPASLQTGKWMQYIISILIIIAPLFLLAGFFIEPHLEDLTRPYSKAGLYALFAVALLVFIIGLKNKLTARAHREN